MAELTVVFVDLTGSTGIFEALGNAKAAEIVTRATQWIGKLCQLRGGRVLKYLGDGVLAGFADNHAAAQTMVEMQRLHTERIRSWPDNIKMQLKVGVARGEVLETETDCFGDAILIATRFSDLAGPEQILATQNVTQWLPSDSDLRFRSLGPMSIRGRADPLPVYRIEWQHEVPSEFLTQPAAMDAPNSFSDRQAFSIDLGWQDAHTQFPCAELPVFLGRIRDARFVVNDPRVSRLHAKLESRGEVCILEDVSSYGTWVRFAGSDAVLALRRQQCVLHDRGELALGGPFEDPGVPVISFRLMTQNAQDKSPAKIAANADLPG